MWHCLYLPSKCQNQDPNLDLLILSLIERLISWNKIGPNVMGNLTPWKRGQDLWREVMWVPVLVRGNGAQEVAIFVYSCCFLDLWNRGFPGHALSNVREDCLIPQGLKSEMHSRPGNNSQTIGGNTLPAKGIVYLTNVFIFPQKLKVHWL